MFNNKATVRMSEVAWEVSLFPLVAPFSTALLDAHTELKLCKNIEYKFIITYTSIWIMLW